MAHEEFPSLTKQAERVLMHAKKGFDVLLNSLDCHPGSQLAQEAAILAAGLAHHCKVQP